MDALLAPNIYIQLINITLIGQLRLIENLKKNVNKEKKNLYISLHLMKELRLNIC